MANEKHHKAINKPLKMLLIAFGGGAITIS